jgi:4-hydroxy-3-polyprenylbenzoate decarboxylase
MNNMKIIIAITGASGIIYSKHLLESTKQLEIETHLIITENAKTVAAHEIVESEKLTNLATEVYEPGDLTALIASGSFKADAMVIIPATMKTIGALAAGYCNNLVTRAADVHLKERRPLIIVPRETPLHSIHLENMAKLSRLGATILPAMPAYYHKPETIEDLVNFIVGKVLDQLDIFHSLYKKWKEN